ncbi:MAG: WD40/YVTN/BNR-like repeat-containing protein, partial [Acidimicrobiales bacterium]
MSQSSADNPSKPSPIERAISGLALRSIGPAFMGGRIADIAIHPLNPTTWFVAVGSGGVWRTTNAGTTWTPVFDDQPSYSIGCVRIDPNRPEVIWVGTGEAVSGRHVAWGDGVYRSSDGGETWSRMGLEHSEHISDILIDPRNGDVVYAAAEGPLWSSGGQRGLFKTVDGGTSWTHVLSVDDDTGVTSAVFAPDNPDVIYAATYQRRRRVWSFLGGGPGSGIHRSTDGGASWDQLTEGLPKSHMGRIGLGVTPADPELVYATVEASDEKEKGFYRSTNRGGTWERRNDYLSGGTGPHYYQEIFVSPTDPNRVYQADVYVHVTPDGGKTFRNLEDGKQKHSDNHVVWIDPSNERHLIVGSDAGLYETF